MQSLRTDLTAFGERIERMSEEAARVAAEAARLEQENAALRTRLTASETECGQQAHQLKLLHGQRLDELKGTGELERLSTTLTRSLQAVGAEQARRDRFCSVCYERPANACFVACGHLSTCIDCCQAGNLLRCPVCRRNSKVVRVFV